MVWILTEEYNDYDQYGEYFLAVFKEKPLNSKLTEYGVPQHRSDHVLNGGGRVGSEDHWFFLREYSI